MRFRPGRPFRRPGPLRPFGPRRPLAAVALRQLEAANQLLAAGRFTEAAPIFAQLANGAETNGMPRRAAQLHLQAARCLIEVRDGPNMLRHVRAGLALLISLGLLEQAQLRYSRIIQELHTRGMQTEAEELQRQFQEQLGLPEIDLGKPAPSPLTAQGAQGKPRRLPTKCPGCGAPVRADEVDWITPDAAQNTPATETAAECPYCGSVLYLE